MTAVASAVTLSGCGGGGGGGGGGKTSTTVTGQVLDSANADAGVGGASVTIGGASATTTTSANATTENPVGTFTIQNASVGASVATVTQAGGTAQQIAFSPPVSAGTNAAIALYINIGEISGKVLLPTGAPASGAFVSSSVNGDNVTTNADGTFLLINVPIGSTTLTAVLGTASATQTVTVSKGVTQVGNITLTEESTGANPPTPPYDIIGKVALSGGAVASGGQVFLLSGGNQLEVTTTDANGQYTFYVPVGAYQLQYQFNGYVTASANVSVTAPSTPLTVGTVTLNPQ